MRGACSNMLIGASNALAGAAACRGQARALHERMRRPPAGDGCARRGLAGRAHPCGDAAAQPKWRASPRPLAPPHAARCAATSARLGGAAAGRAPPPPPPATPKDQGPGPGPDRVPPQCAPGARAGVADAQAGRARLPALVAGAGAAAGIGYLALVSAGACRRRAPGSLPVISVANAFLLERVHPHSMSSVDTARLTRMHGTLARMHMRAPSVTCWQCRGVSEVRHLLSRSEREIEVK